MKRILLPACMLFVAFANYAQIPLGFKAGINSNKMAARNNSSDYSFPFESITSFHLGVFSKLKLSNKLNFIPELQFIQKQSRPAFPNSNAIKLSYIEIPLLISFQPLTWLGIEGGPSVGIHIAGNVSSNTFNLADAGANGGLRFSPTSKWSILTRYYYGLSPIEKIYMSSSDEVRIYNQNIQFSLAYYLK